MAASKVGITIRKQILVVSSTLADVKETKIDMQRNTLVTIIVRLLAFTRVSGLESSKKFSSWLSFLFGLKIENVFVFLIGFESSSFHF